jgi:16S rRNA (uracil1498-N3)-methyltransferase
MRLAGSPGPHVFVDSLDSPRLDDDDQHHLVRVLRIRSGEPLTISDGQGRWRLARYAGADALEPEGPVVEVPAPEAPRTVAFSLVKGNKPELVVQKLTELGIEHIVALEAERSVVRWSPEKVEHQRGRWERIAREAAMQSHRVRLPVIEGLLDARSWLARPDVHAAHFGGEALGPHHRSVAIGPEGGWSDAELDAAGSRTVALGDTVLRAETAALAAGTLLCAMSVGHESDST